MPLTSKENYRVKRDKRNQAGSEAPDAQRSMSPQSVDPEVERAVARAVEPGVAPAPSERGARPHPKADRGPDVLPTYQRHPEVSA